MNKVWVKKSPTKRLFVAIPLSKYWQKTLTDVQEELKKRHIARDTPTRWTPFESFHITVGFIGSVPEREVPKIIETVRQLAVGSFTLPFLRFEIATPKDPKMIWARFTATSEFLALVRRCKKTLRLRNGHAIIPHVTIARMKGEMTRAGKVESVVHVPQYLSITSLVLYESKTLPTGSVYHTIATFRL